jgi:uncharacterized SAM-binding protein YcdF (DUF218 family)
MRMNRKVFVGLGFLSILYYAALTIFGGRISFSEFWILMGIFLITIGSVEPFLKRNRLISSKRTKRVFFTFFSLIMASFIIIEGFIIYYGSHKKFKESDYILILGAGLRGERLSLTLSQRMFKSLEYLEEYPNTKIIVSGGQGPGEDITEAEAMKRFLISHGIDEKQIIKEDKSTSTSENLLYSKGVLSQIDSNEKLKISIVTTDFHMFRTKFLANRVGFEVYSVPSKLHPLLAPNYYVREYLAVINSYFFDKIE